MLRTLRTDGPALAVRRTTGEAGPAGAAQVHLVGTAAGPVGGDTVEVRLVVGEGAVLHVAGVAATVVLPGREEPVSHLLVEVDVAPGGLLVCALPPVVVTGRAGLRATTRVRLVGDGQVRLVEHVRLGRHDEPGGRWRGQVDVTRDGAPLLRQTTSLGEDPDDGLRDLRSTLDTRDPAVVGAEGAATTAPPDRGARPAPTDPGTVVMDLARGGTLTVTLGRSGGAGVQVGDRPPVPS